MTNYILDAIREVDDTPDGLSIEMQMNFSRIVLKRIKDLELTQRKLAERSGKFESYISRVLNGDENISIKRMAEILFALDKTQIAWTIVGQEKTTEKRRLLRPADTIGHVTTEVPGLQFCPSYKDDSSGKEINFETSKTPSVPLRYVAHG